MTESTYELKQHDSFEINECLEEMVNFGASDVHLIAEEHPMYRKNGKIEIARNYPVVTEEVIIDAVKQILPVQAVPRHFLTKLETSNDFDFCYEIPKVSRFRINVCSRMYKKGMVIRTIPLEPLKIADLYLPPAIESFTEFNNGLVLVTGPTGSGKSTTLASLIDYINQTQQKHIISIEDPVEFVFSNKKCIISQRQVEFDT